MRSHQILIILGTLGTGLFLLVLGIYFYLKEQQYDVSALSLLPMVCLAGILFLAYMSYMPVAYVVSSEVLPRKVRIFMC